MSDPGLLVLDGAGALTVANVLMNCAAWDFDLAPLWDGPELTGTNVSLPGVESTVAFRRWRGQTTYSLDGWITGAVDLDGDPYANPVMGLVENQDYLLESVQSVEDPSVYAELEMPDASIRVADVQAAFVFGKLEGRYDKPVVCLLTVVSAPGRFIEISS